MASNGTTKRVAKFGCLSVRKELGTCELATELTRLLSAKCGHRWSRPDAVHAAIANMVGDLREGKKKGGAA